MCSNAIFALVWAPATKNQWTHGQDGFVFRNYPLAKSKNARGFGSGLYSFTVGQHVPSFPELGNAPRVALARALA
jgi:hypothetical protein